MSTVYQVCNLWFGRSVFSIKHRRGLGRGANTPAPSDVHKNTLLHYYLCANPHQWWPDAPCRDAQQYFKLLLYFQRGQQSRPHPLPRTSILYISGLEWKTEFRADALLWLTRSTWWRAPVCFGLLALINLPTPTKQLRLVPWLFTIPYHASFIY